MTVKSRVIAFVIFSLGMTYAFGGEDVVSPPDPDKSFAEAWDAYKNGDFEQAETTVDKVLDTSDMGPYHKANYNYLKGILLGRQLAHEEAARACFETAREHYGNIGSNQGVFNTNLSLIKLLLDIKDFGPAEEALYKNLEIAQNAQYPEGYIHYLLSSLAHLRGDYPAGLTHAFDSLHAYQVTDDERGIADSLSVLGFFQIVNGQMHEGLESTLLAQTRIAKLEDANKTYYNQVNLILYNRCSQGFLLQGVANDIAERIERDNDEALEGLLSFVINFDCCIIPKNCE